MVALFVTVLSASSPAADAPFAPATRLEAEIASVPSGLALGDFNRDGLPDCAVTHEGDSVAILLGDGKGAMVPHRAYAVPGNPYSVVTADFDQDGRQDLAIPTEFNVTILLGKPVGEFGSRTDYATGGSSRAVAVADFDNDSKLDLAISGGSTNLIAIRRGIGTGAFHPETTLPVAASIHCVAAGDVDNDGRVDLVTATATTNKLLFLRGKGDGSFEPKVETTIDFGALSVALGDLDADGDLDAVTANYETGNVAVAYWNGTGFSAVADLYPVGPFPSSAVIGDVSGDGRPDLVATLTTSTQLKILRRTDTGFGAAETLDGPGHQLLKVAADDVDQDGRVDLTVAARNQHRLIVFRNFGDGPLSPGTDYATLALPGGTTFTDVTGDGHLDLLNTSYLVNVLSLRPGDGEGGFGARVDLVAPLTHPEGLAPADVNGDGIPDLAVFSRDHDSLKVMLGTGAGTFTPGSTPYVGSIANPVAVAFGRVDADTFPDMAVANSGINTIRVFPNDGKGGFGAGFVDYVSGSLPLDVLLVDVDGDTDQDLAYVNYLATTVVVRKNDGTGLFGSVTGAATPAQVKALAAGDLNGDGRNDLVTCATGAVSVFLNPGNGVFLARTDYTIYPSASDVAVLDFDGDGRLDVLVTNNEGTLNLLFGDGKGRLGPIRALPASSQPFAIAVGDLDTDGRPDVAVTVPEPPGITVYLSRAPTRTTLGAGPNPCPLGGMLTLNATVVVPDGTQTPAGTVRFHDGFALLGTAPVMAGVATLSFPASFAWFRSFSAEFVGTERLRPSRSASIPLMVYESSVDVGPEPGNRGGLALDTPHPNPVRGAGLVARFTLPADRTGDARLALHDVRGRRLEVIEVAALGPGTHAVTVQPAAGLPAGLYFLRLEAAGASVTRRVVVLGR